MEENICYIVGAGENYGLDFTPRQGDYVIAADGGLKYIEEAGVTPNLVVGDFDSLKEKPSGYNVVVAEAEKDETDSLLAIQQGMQRGYQCFHLFACTGGRMDHTFANIQLLAYLSNRKMQGLLFDKECVITAITNGVLTLSKRESGYISVFSHSERAKGVSLQGMKYTLDKAELTNHFPLGVSNAFIGKEVTIEVETGTLLVYYPRDVMGKITK